MKLNTIEKVTFGIATVLFAFAIVILYKNWNVPKVTIESFAALEYSGIYVLTLYDHFKEQK